MTTAEPAAVDTVLRTRLRRRFLAAQGVAQLCCEALPADASQRRYFRLHAAQRSMLLMDAPPPHEQVAPFLDVARHLLGMALSAPRILAADRTLGFVLLEDFGDATFTRLLRRGHSEAALYGLAVDVLVHLHRQAAATTLAVPSYDTATLLAEAALLTDWYMPRRLGQPVDDRVRAAYLDAWRETLTALPPLPSSLVLRDFHVDNLMLLPQRSAHRACGLLDFQDALIGPVAYDLVSLLEDARRDVSAAVRAAALARYCDRMPAIDPVALDSWCAVLGAQRHAKVLGIFVRLHVRDGKGAYLPHLPRVQRMLSRRLAESPLAAVRAWFDTHLGDLQDAWPVRGGAERCCP